MAPLPPENTERYFLDYSVCGINHTLEMRVDDGTLPGDASDAFDALFTALSIDLFEVTVNGMRHSDNGSTFSFPAVYTGGTTFGSGAGTPADGGGYASWIGRSDDGRRVKWSVFGVKVTATAGDWRSQPGETAAYDDALALFTTASGIWLTISGLQPIVNQYTNAGYNAYWRNHTR